MIPDKLPVLEQEIAKFLAGEEKLPHHCKFGGVVWVRVMEPALKILYMFNFISLQPNLILHPYNIIVHPNIKI